MEYGFKTDDEFKAFALNDVLAIFDSNQHQFKTLFPN